MRKKKTNISFQEFLENKKEDKTANWEAVKNEWIDAVNTLYNKVDGIIVANFEKAGYEVKTEKEEVRIIEDFIGSYYISNYSVKANQFSIHFYPISAIMIGSKGRVDMILPKGRVKLLLTNNNEWKIVKGPSMDMDLVDFNEKNIQKTFEEDL